MIYLFFDVFHYPKKRNPLPSLHTQLLHEQQQNLPISMSLVLFEVSWTSHWLVMQVREQEFDFNIWSQSLNSLSWTEILRQVLTAAGFGVKYNSANRDIVSKVLKICWNMFLLSAKSEASMVCLIAPFYKLVYFEYMAAIFSLIWLVL